MLARLKRLFARRAPSLYDAQTFAVMDRLLRPDSVCVDVGAHKGTILAEMLARSPRGQHYAFEPLPEPFALLESKFGGRSNVHLYRVALAEEAGPSTFQHVVSRPTFSGLKRRRYERDETIVEVQVERCRLDDVIPADTNVDFVKVDVEGGEYGVFVGAQEVLRRSRPAIVFEHGLGGADCYGVEPEQVHDVLDGCGLRLSTMQRFLEGTAAFTRAEFAHDFRSGANYYFMAYAR